MTGAILLPTSVRHIELNDADVKTLLDLTTFASPVVLTLGGRETIYPVLASQLGDVARSMRRLHRLHLNWNNGSMPDSLEAAVHDAPSEVGRPEPGDTWASPLPCALIEASLSTLREVRSQRSPHH